MQVGREISKLIAYGKSKGLIMEEDETYTRNRLFALLGTEELWGEEPPPENPGEVLNNLCDYAEERGILNCPRDQFDTELMAVMTPRPSEVKDMFFRLYAADKKAATDYYYSLSIATNYIRADRIARDRKWTAKTPYGELIITINLSKPEKDPKEIAMAKTAPQAGYPKCALCRENEGFLGSANQAARGNLRLIPLDLCGERWYLQYSPYVYYNEHCIVLSGEHRPMKVDRKSLERLLDFTELFPHYFIGSNADLPIVGGSILTHDHFQGGNFEFPMAKASIREEVAFPGYSGVSAGILNWPMSVIRLRSGDKFSLIDLADRILQKWRGYSDESAEILAFSDGAPHNTITPIARRRGKDFELDLVLRNNRTTKEHPLGLFHPHAEYHHIKKENIGLIEVMGLAILPPRLLKELKQVEDAIISPGTAEEIFSSPAMAPHRPWYDELMREGASAQNAGERIALGVGKIFGEILGNAGVFKDTESGREAFRRFVKAV